MGLPPVSSEAGEADAVYRATFTEQARDRCKAQRVSRSPSGRPPSSEQLSIGRTHVTPRFVSANLTRDPREATSTRRAAVARAAAQAGRATETYGIFSR